MLILKKNKEKHVVKSWSKRIAALCGAVIISLLGVLNIQAADVNGMEYALEQVDQLQQMAEDYLLENEQSGDAMVLTINYIRAKRYDHFTWDMILGTANQAFSEYVQQNAPELKNLQTMKNVQVEATQEQVDFVHLIAGIGATYRRMPVICTWGGDCIQLAESIWGSSGDEAACMQQLNPYFASEDENASLLPQSDWLADLDGVNIGSTLKKEDRLAEKIREYYSEIDSEERAVRFVQTQFGAVDTQNTEEFRAKVKQTFQNDPGVQLFLMSKEYMTLDEEKNGVIIPQMEQPLNAVCSLMADELAQWTQGIQISEPDSEQEASTEPESVPHSVQIEQPDEEIQVKGEKIAHMILLIIGVLIIIAVILLVALLKK